LALDMPRLEDSSEDPSDFDSQLQQQVYRLHQITVYSRWAFVAFLWLVIAPLCLWHLRSEFALWLDYFTWTAVRYTIIFNRVASIALVLCVAWTVSTIVWQIRHKGWGMSREERRLLERRVLRIRKRGQGHPLWRWVVKGNSPGERLRHR
jgi:hypothetical protein